MHQFLKSVGFGNLTELEEQDRLLRDVLLHYDYKKVVETESGHLFAEIAKEYAPDIGIMICGEYDKENLTPMIRTSICTGEQVAGFKDKRSGKFEEIALIKNDADLFAFKAQYGIEGEIPKFY